MGVPTIKTGPMTVEEYFAFTDTRPDNEKWELIDGEPILNASPSNLHQGIAFDLKSFSERSSTGVLSPGRRLPGLACGCPTPAFRSRTYSSCRGSSEAESVQPRNAGCLAAFEILSPSTADRDLRWKRTAYTSLPSLTHYVVVAQDAVDVVVFARDTDFAERRYRSLSDTIELPALGILLPLSEIYRDTGLE